MKRSDFLKALGLSAVVPMSVVGEGEAPESVDFDTLPEEPELTPETMVSTLDALNIKPRTIIRVPLAPGEVVEVGTLVSFNRHGDIVAISPKRTVPYGVVTEVHDDDTVIVERWKGFEKWTYKV